MLLLSIPVIRKLKFIASTKFSIKIEPSISPKLNFSEIFLKFYSNFGIFSTLRKRKVDKIFRFEFIASKEINLRKSSMAREPQFAKVWSIPFSLYSFRSYRIINFFYRHSFALKLNLIFPSNDSLMIFLCF